ncbi:MAG: CPBP family glutamic-type intramembrane protease, partial [Pirellulaceae bacterium]
FRWVIQGGIASYWSGPIGQTSAIFIAGLLFGVCHWVNSVYGIVTTIVGIYLGFMMVIADTWLAPMVAHAVYDFIAIVYMVDRLPIKFASRL